MNTKQFAVFACVSALFVFGPALQAQESDEFSDPRYSDGFAVDPGPPVPVETLTIDTPTAQLEWDVRASLDQGRTAEAARRVRQFARDSIFKEWYLGRACLYEGNISKAIGFLNKDTNLSRADLMELCAWQAQEHDPKGALRLWDSLVKNTIEIEGTAGHASQFREKLLEKALVPQDTYLTDRELRFYGLKRFQPHTLSVFVQPRNDPFDSQFKKIVNTAMYRWRDAANYGFDYSFTDSPEHAQIIISWAPYKPKEPTPPASWCGYSGSCSIEPSADKQHIKRARVQIPTFMLVGTHYRDVQCMDSCLHHLGHAIGVSVHGHGDADCLKDYSRYPGDVHPHWVLSEHDRSVARALYSPHRFFAAVPEQTFSWRHYWMLSDHYNCAFVDSTNGTIDRDSSPPASVNR